MEEKNDKLYADYTSEEMIKFLVKNYPNGKLEKLTELYVKGEIGSVLYNVVKIVLEGFDYD